MSGDYGLQAFVDSEPNARREAIAARGIVYDTRSFVTWVHCHTCHEEWLSPAQESACVCLSSRDEDWHVGRSHRRAFYSRPLLIPCTGQCEVPA